MMKSARHREVSIPAVAARRWKSTAASSGGRPCGGGSPRPRAGTPRRPRARASVPFVSSSSSSSRASSVRKLPRWPWRDIAAMRRKIRFVCSSCVTASSDSMSCIHSSRASTVQRPPPNGIRLAGALSSASASSSSSVSSANGISSRPARDPRREAGQPLGRRSTRAASAGSTPARLAPRLRLRAGPARGALGRAHRQPLAHDLARQLRGGPRVRERRAPRAHGPRSARRARPSRARRPAARAGAAGSRPPASSGRPVRRPRRARARIRRAAPRRRAPPRPETAARARRSRPAPSRSASRSAASRTRAGSFARFASLAARQRRSPAISS